MRIEDVLGTNFTRRLSLHFDGVKEEDINEVAGMLRGLMCALEGWGAISGLDNEKFSEAKPLVLTFKSAENADYFKQCVHYYFSEQVLAGLRVVRRVHKIPNKSLI